jgi:predicted LPLAT superfamily acyltransferase
MGKKAGEQIEGVQKNNLQKKGVEIIANHWGQGSPMDILEGVKYLRKGWILSIAGDRFGDAGRSFVEASFLGHAVRLPEIPYALSLATGVPIFIFFAFRTGRRKYQFIIHQPIYLCADSRKSRKECARKAAQQYARLLEHAVYNSPFEWYHFEQFFGRKKAPKNKLSQGA